MTADDVDAPRHRHGSSHQPSHSHGHSHNHEPSRSLDQGHSHGHGHGLEGSWEVWLAVPVLRLILGAVALIAVATIVAMVMLWPDGSGTAAANEEAGTLGLASQQLDATVESVFEGDCSYATVENPAQCRAYTVVMDEGPDAGALVALPEFDLVYGGRAPDLAEGDAIKVGYEPSTQFYFYGDRDRENTLLLITGLFAAVVIALARWRGVTALAAMAMTVVVLVGFIAPSVLDGNDPVLVSVVAGSVIAFLSLYLTHGFTPTTTVALAGTLASLLLTLVIAAVFFDLANFTGLATEEGLTLPLIADINMSSLLLGGAILGTLGALDDVTVTQVATVAELRHRNPNLTIAELVASGIRVGQEHIASTVNTLLLAYAGASMPLLLLFAAANQPLGVVANSELVAVEIVRTLAGSIGLVAAVPVTTIMAAVLVGTSPVPTPNRADAGTDRPTDDPANHPTDPAGHEPDDRPAEPARPPARWEDFGPLET